jgi:hypothetical protein
VTRVFCTAIAFGLLSLAPSADASPIALKFFSPSAYTSDTAAMNEALGITGHAIDDFETTAFVTGLTMTLSGNVATTTYTGLPSLQDEHQCGAYIMGAWDGTHVASNAINNQLNSCYTPTGLASLTTFGYAQGTTSFGIALSNFQSMSSPEFPVANHELLVNGVDMGSLEMLAGASWRPGMTRNAYLLISSTADNLITSVGFRNVNGNDFLEFDHLAVGAGSGAPGQVPEPASFVLLGSGLVLGILGTRRRT